MCNPETDTQCMENVRQDKKCKIKRDTKSDLYKDNWTVT